MADDRLNEKPGDGSSEPKVRQLVRMSAQVFVDGAHVRHLQTPAKLDAGKTETHVPYLPER